MESVPKPPPPLLGFNNNVRHRGVVFHIQTEDSGVKHARIMTHLFADGGRIIESARTDYAEHLGRDDMVQVLRSAMKEQHKAMFIRLRAGQLDAQIEAAVGPLPVPPAAKPAARAEPPRAPEDLPLSSPLATSLEPQLSSPPTRAARQSGRLSNPSLQRVATPLSTGESGELELDMASLDQQRVRTDDPRRARALARTSPPPPPIHTAECRYAASRPPAIFGDIPQPGASIFGEKMISQKSLDEVILSYLADELSPDDGPNE